MTACGKTTNSKARANFTMRPLSPYMRVTTAVILIISARLGNTTMVHFMLIYRIVC